MRHTSSYKKCEGGGGMEELVPINVQYTTIKITGREMPKVRGRFFITEFKEEDL